ncbi:MAG: MotA/TolQ/ExbB proton channel family protein [Desulfovibrio sp.]|jgi:biopolymer transport protein ExbB|nr:MotA/TolQ/ExbB proton channel family protein [Desulfovibrio sp.]
MNSETLILIYNRIGAAGCALVLISLAGVYLALKNIILISLINRDFRRRFALIEAQSKPGYEELQAAGNPLISVIAEAAGAHATHSHDLRAEVAYLFHRNFEHINRDIAWLKLISVLSPLLGLMGTMLGMVSVFRELAVGPGGANAAVLANGIWEALLTTIMGLTIAIPALVIFYWLSLKMKGFHIEAIEHSYRAVKRFPRDCRAGEPFGETASSLPPPGAERPSPGAY